MMAIKTYGIDPDALATCRDDDRPLALIALDACSPDVVIGRLPLFPVIGIGDFRHPLAARLDAVIEPPVSADQIVANIERAPCTAAALVQLLRSIEALPPEPALTIESMSLAMLQGSVEHTKWLAERVPGPMTESGRVHVERQNDGLSITLDRPWAHNAIDRAMRDALHAAFSVAAIDPDIHRVTLRSVGPTFSVGADLAEFGTTRDPATAHAIRMRTLPAWAKIGFAGRIDAHAPGACVGSGLELAAFASWFTASRLAWFQLPELRMGIIPGAGGCVSVMGRIGRQRTALMILSGRRINAETALRWKLIDAIVDTLPRDEYGAHPIG